MNQPTPLARLRAEHACNTPTHAQKIAEVKRLLNLFNSREQNYTCAARAYQDPLLVMEYGAEAAREHEAACLTAILADLERMEWRGIESAPRDGAEFLSWGGLQGRLDCVYPTRWLSPGPYSTENGKNAQGERRYQCPDGFYWAGYDGFVGPIEPTHWMPLPEPPTP